MAEYIWRGNKPLRRSREHPDPDEIIEPGEPFEPTNRELDHLNANIEVVETQSPVKHEADPTDPRTANMTEDEARADSGGVSPPFDPGDLSVRELRERLADGDYDDAELAALADAERDGEDRVSALDAIGV